MSDAKRITASEVKDDVDSGATLLVCAYDDDSKFEKFHLEGAIPLSAFKTREADVPKETPLVFYCA